MALIWQCDRCKNTSGNGTGEKPPDDWEPRIMPVRGRASRSNASIVLCKACDDSLYRWLTTPDPQVMG